MLWVVVIGAALVLSLAYRVVRYRAIRSQGHDVQWSVPIARWTRKLRRR